MILITGSQGQLGRAVQEKATRLGIAFRAPDRSALDVANAEALDEFLEAARAAGESFDCIINCAAYTQVDAAEAPAEAAKAYAANALAPWLLASTGIPILHVSTDYVFDGNSTTPYKEDAPCRPVSVYGLTKRAGEAALLESGALGAIVRTAWVYSARPSTRNFFQTMKRLGSDPKRDKLTVVNDQRGAPTLAEDLAEALLTLYQKGAHLQPMHILHFTNSGACTWFEFAREIVRLTGGGVPVEPIPTSAYPTRSSRPAYSVLSLDAIADRYGIRPRHWLDALSAAVAESVDSHPLHRF